jgi:hypothetical protein
LEQSDVAAPLLRRLRSLLLYPQLRLSLGQATSGFDLDSVLRDSQILMVPLSKKDLGAELATLTGALVVTALAVAFQRRRTDAPLSFVFMDEFVQILRGVPLATGDIFSLARQYQIGLHVAMQQIGPLGEKMRDEVFANARSKVVFQTTHATNVLAGQLGSEGSGPQLRSSRGGIAGEPR